MESLRTLLRPRSAATIPQWQESLDDAKLNEHGETPDLLVKALHYMFKRFAIESAQLPSPATVAAAADPDSVAELYLHSLAVPGLSRSDQEKLDKLYNAEAFRRLLVLDRHRVLVDWVKNRFRAMLILEHEPQMETLPPLAQKNYRFLILSPDASRDEYIRTLAGSDIFVEHGLPLVVRSGIAAKLYDVYRPTTRAARQHVIVEFVRQTGIETQVARLYKASLRTPLNVRSLNIPARQRTDDKPPANPLRMRFQPPAPPASQVRERNHNAHQTDRNITPNSQSSADSATPSYGSSDSSRSSSGGSHVKLSIVQPSGGEKESAPRLRMKSSSQMLRPGTAPSIPAAGAGAMTEAGRKQMLTQARMAVRSRLDREQAMIQYERTA